MVQFDPGPPPEVSDHFEKLPSYAPHRDLFWYDWGRSSIVGGSTGQPGCSASPPIRAQQNG